MKISQRAYQYYEAKVNDFLNNTAKPSVERDRARRRLLEAMNNANKTFKQLGVKPIKFWSKGRSLLSKWLPIWIVVQQDSLINRIR